MPPLPSDAEPRPPEDFAPLLATKEPVLLVGGQAVNLWAMYYETRTADLAPFVSRDVDVLGDLATLEALGKLAGTKPQFFPVKPPTNEIGVVIAKDHNGQPLLIEVLRYVHGVSNEELRDRKVFKQLQFDARSLFAGLGHEKLRKLRAFIDKRVPRELS